MTNSANLCDPKAKDAVPARSPTTPSLAEVEERMGLPTVDPIRIGSGRLVDALMAL